LAGQELDALTGRGIHHVGASVEDLDAALAFWEPLLGRPARFRVMLDRPYIGGHVGHPGVQIEAAFLDLPGGGVLELLDYQLEGRGTQDPDTANPGNVHLCLRVDDCLAAFAHAVACGARPVRPEGPVEIDGGPNRGARAAYLRVPDGITLELFQPAEGS
jgi:catechol 2,3-dioxygenase-like lactoylglutathione lyase family enzyme